MSEEQRAPVYARTIRAVPPRERTGVRCHAGALNPNGRLDEAAAVRIFLSPDSISVTAKRESVSEGHVASIWNGNRWGHVTAGLQAPERVRGRRRTPHAKRTHRPASGSVTPEMLAFLQANAEDMTAIDLAFALDISEPHVRKLCNEYGLTWRNGWGGENPKNAEPGYEPGPLPEGMTHTAPAGSREKVIEMRKRAEKGLPIWDPDDDCRQYPQCVAKIEAPKQEPIL